MHLVPCPAAFRGFLCILCHLIHQSDFPATTRLCVSACLIERVSPEACPMGQVSMLAYFRLVHDFATVEMHACGAKLEAGHPVGPTVGKSTQRMKGSRPFHLAGR